MKSNRLIRVTFLTVGACALLAGPALTSQMSSTSNGVSAQAVAQAAFLERLAALVPPPRAHVLTYHAVLAPASALRAAIVPRAPAVETAERGVGAGAGPAADRCAGKRPARTSGRHPWAELLKRVFAVDALRCRCGGQRKIIAAITQSEVIGAILAALHLPTEAPVVHPARGQPGLFEEK